MPTVKPCVLVYNPISGHGHLDSWNLLIVQCFIKMNWRVVAVSPDVSNVSRFFQENNIDFSSDVFFIEFSSVEKKNQWQRIVSLSRRTLVVLYGHGESYFYKRPSSQVTLNMPLLLRCRKWVLNLVMPSFFVAIKNGIQFARMIYRRKQAGVVEAVSEKGFFCPTDFARRVNAAIIKSPWQPQLIFNTYLDMYRTDYESWDRFEKINAWPWAGIRFVPGKTPVENYLGLGSLAGVCVLDDSKRVSFQRQIPEKIFGYLPDVTNAALPDEFSSLVLEIKQRASGRKIVFMGGSIGIQKNLTCWYELVAMLDPKLWFFVQIGEIHYGSLTMDDLAALENVLATTPENLLIVREYLSDERDFNDAIRASDAIFAVYRDFFISSNMLAKAAAFGRPILVAEGWLMAQRVKKYGIGIAVNQSNVDSIYRGLLSVFENPPAKTCYEAYLADFGVDAFESNLQNFVLGCLGAAKSGG
jgi:hypothetical protein